LRNRHLLGFIFLTTVLIFGNYLPAQPIEENHNFSLEWEFSNSVSINTYQIHSLPYRSLEEILALQNGVVEMRDRDGIFSSSESELHVRGGRDYENGFYLNGVNVVDPITGVYTANFSIRALERIDFYSGGFPAQFGNANSSIIEMSTISGGEKISGYGEILTDNEIGSDFGKTNYLISLDGPITKSKNLRFFGLVERTRFDDRYPSPITDDALPGSPIRLPNNWLEGWTYHGRLDFGLNNRMNLSAHLDGSNQEWREYQHAYYFDSAHSPFHDDDNLAIGGTFNHEIVANQTSYTIGASFFRSERFQGDGVYKDDLWAYGRPGGNYGTDPFNLFYYSDIDSTAVVTDTVRVYMSATDTVGQPRTFVVGGDEGHVYSNYLRHRADVFSLAGELNHSFRKWHRGTLGIEYKRSAIRYYQHLFPDNVWEGVPGNGFVDAINYGYDDFGNESDKASWENEIKNPVTLSAFLENKFTYDKLEISPCIRLDRWDLDALKFRNVELPLDPDSLQFNSNPNDDSLIQTLELSDMEAVDAITRLSPRLSVRVPFKNGTTIHGNAGIYFQMAPYQYLFNDYEFFDYKIRTGGYYIPLGNSALQPQKNTLLEVGLSQEINQDVIKVLLGVKGFYKWSNDEIQVYTQPSLPRAFATYRNADQADVYGLELMLNLKYGKYTNIEFRRSMAKASGTGSFANAQGNVAWVNANSPINSAPLDYDQQEKFAMKLEFDFRNKSEDLNQIIQGLVFNFILKYGSGLPYTPIQVTNEATLGAFAPIAIDYRNAHAMPYTVTLDFYLERSITLSHLRLTPFVSGTNLVDKKNVANVWNGSGLPNSTAWLQTPEGQQFIQATSSPDYTGLNGEGKYYIREQVPQHYYAPRQFFFGLKAEF